MRRRLVLSLVLGLSLAISQLDKSVVVLPSGERCIAGQILVKLDTGMNRRVCSAGSRFGIRELDALCQREGLVSVGRFVRQANPLPALRATGVDRLFLLTFGTGADVRRLIAEFERLPGVEGVWPNAVMAECGQRVEVPDDSRYGEQWHLPRIKAPAAWESAHGDDSVIIAVLDDGVFYPHEDIEANLWVNSPEDINGNGRFDSLSYPDGDLDGTDQDGNGYTDDVIGYDFYGSDPVPAPEESDSHGTFCWGAANAVTNNGVGVAAPAWNCRAMALRCGGGGSISIGAAIAAISYALDKGAWVISMSFGSSSPYPPMDDACQAIWQSGAMSVAAAGGDGRTPVYPAAYENVVAVAASDTIDKKAPFSAWGDWIDVCAPGVGILSTRQHGYVVVDGSSFATAIVAGVLAWLKSAHPEITNDSARALLYNYCDSMPDSLYRAGLLGHGRVAMTDSVSGVVEQRRTEETRLSPAATVVRGVLVLNECGGNGDNPSERGDARYSPHFPVTSRTALLDVSGRAVMALKLGANGVARLAPGVYFVRGRELRKVILTH